MKAMPLLEVSGLTKRYRNRRGEDVAVVDGVSFEVNAGETLGIVGESGSGKSTVARLLLRLLPADAGGVRFDGKDVLRASPGEMRRLRRDMQIVFQDPMASLNPRMRVEEIVTEPLQIHASALGEAGVDVSPAARHRLAAGLLEQVGLDRTALSRFPHEFSGGQRQRISIARAIALRPRLLVLDEPVSALDVRVAAQVINLLRSLQAELGLTCLFISHGMPLVRYFCDRIVVMQRGRVVESGSAEQVCDAPREAYTQALIAATPTLPSQAVS